MNVTNLIFQAITLNEVGATPEKFIYSFSDPDGINTGKSGYSFGRSQFDIQNNWKGIHCLEECGFTPAEVTLLFKQNGAVSKLEAKLLANKGIVDKYDTEHIQESINHCLKLVKQCDPSFSPEDNIEAFANIVDYHNQFYLSPNGKLHRYLKQSVADSGVSVLHEPTLILNFKLNNTKWGRTHPSDIKRRYNNIAKLVSQL